MYPFWYTAKKKAGNFNQAKESRDDGTKPMFSSIINQAPRLFFFKLISMEHEFFPAQRYKNAIILKQYYAF